MGGGARVGRRGRRCRGLTTRLLAAVKETGRVRADITAIDTAVLMSGIAAALTSRKDFTEASWHRAGDLVLAACGSYPPDLEGRPG